MLYVCKRYIVFTGDIPSGTSPLLRVPLSMVRPRSALIRLVASNAHAEGAAGHALYPIMERHEQPSKALSFTEYIRSDTLRMSCSLCINIGQLSSDVIGLAEMFPDGTNSIRVISAPG
ncbi:hypothetical protein EVAR_17101_1 [Eumeta japonica]|uniref:Uncharacterized protein n=1 Tax=Eumeta variegata TaxID=151549 RepID=A0A4C1ULT4_EUMVA|nr:hypothetical protein EVAR_17101_1 [Eumeta japonica]